MRRQNFIVHGTILLAIAGLILPPQALAQVAARTAIVKDGDTRAMVSDQALGSGGVLRGQVLDSQGVGADAARVTLYSGSRVVAAARTDNEGRFAFVGLNSGLYMVSTPGATRVIRAWAPEVAPPAAQQGVLLVPGEELIRGQYTGGGNFFNPATVSALMVAGVIGGAVAIVSEDSSSGS